MGDVTITKNSKVSENAKNALLNQQNETPGGEKKKSIFDLVKSQEGGFKLALPEDWDASRFTRMCLTALKNNPKLQSCTVESILGGMMLGAQLGLEINTPLQESYLIPYDKKKKVGDKWIVERTDAQFQWGYRGLLKLIWNSGLVINVDYDKICENDELDYYKGFDSLFRHKPLLKGDRGKPYAYYAFAEIKGGGRVLIVKSRDEIVEHANRFSKAFGDKYKDSPWQTDFDMMAIKTALKELADKKLPKRSSNEALKFMSALYRDESIVRLDTDKQLNQKINIDDLSSEPVILPPADKAEDANILSEKKFQSASELNSIDDLFSQADTALNPIEGYKAILENASSISDVERYEKKFSNRILMLPEGDQYELHKALEATKARLKIKVK